MCGRFTLHTPAADILHEFELQATERADEILPPRYNIAPSQGLAAVALKRDGTGRGFAYLRWGLTPPWSDGRVRPINARNDTVATSGMFRKALAERRCLVPADGFIEWKPEGKKKQPFHFHLASGELFAFAGLFETHKEFGPSCCIITTEPNELVAKVHDRMPVILHKSVYAKWLDPSLTTAELLAMMVPFPAEEMEGHAISDYVNNAKHEGPQCLVRPVTLFAEAG